MGTNMLVGVDKGRLERFNFFKRRPYLVFVQIRLGNGTVHVSLTVLFSCVIVSTWSVLLIWLEPAGISTFRLKSLFSV